jgi:hypothetical protein
MTHHLDRPLRTRMTGVHVAEATNIRRLSAEHHRASAGHIAALAFVGGVIAGMLIGAMVTL